MSTLRTFAVFYPVNAGATPVLGPPSLVMATDWWDARVRFAQSHVLPSSRIISHRMAPEDPCLLVVEMPKKNPCTRNATTTKET